MDPSIFMTLNQTILWENMSDQYRQTTNCQTRTDFYPLFSSLRPTDSEKKGLRFSFAFLQTDYLQDGRVNETLATVEKLSDLWNPGAMEGIPPFVTNCFCF